MDRTDLAKMILVGVVLGVTAAAVVWWLERFQTERLVGELRTHLDTMSDEYRAWLAQRPRPGKGGGR
jgi:ABC-type cobalamin transport system permease subunit